MPNPNLDSENGGSQGSLAPWGSAVNFGQWSANALARWFATYAPGFYLKAGGNLALFTPNSPQQNYIGGFTGPQEVAQMYDARKVVTYMLNHLDETYQQELALNLYQQLGPNAIVGPGGYDPLTHLFWTPGNELAAVVNAFVQGIIPQDAFEALVGLGYDLPHAADILNQFLVGYKNGEANVSASNQPAWLCGPNGRLLSYLEVLEYLNIYTGETGPSLWPKVPLVQIGNEMVYVPFDATMAAQEGQALISEIPAGTPGFGQPSNWKQLLYNQIANPPGSGPPMAGRQYMGCGIGFTHLTLAYRLPFGDQRDALLTLLAFTTDIITRYDAVPIEAKLLATKGQQGATSAKIAYSVWDLISPVPLTPTDKRALKLGGQYNPASHFPTRLQAWLITGYNGLMPIILVSSGGLPVYTPDYITGKPKQSVVGLNPAYLQAFEQLWRARIAFYALNGGYKTINFGSIGKDSSGNPVVSMYGSLLKFVKNPDGTPALPYSDNNDDYADATKFSDVALANVFQVAVVSDIVLAPLLGLVQGGVGKANSIDQSKVNADVAADFYSNPNNATMRDAWLRATAKPSPFSPSTTVITIPPLPPSDNIDIGPYGTLNPATA